MEWVGRAFAAAAFAAALVVSQTALAQTAPAETTTTAPAPASGSKFGERSEFVLSLERFAGFQSQKFGEGDGESHVSQSVDGFGIHPFFWGAVGLHGIQSSGLTLGALLGLSTLHIPANGPNDKSDTLWIFQVRPRLGYAGWLQKGLGYWLRIGPSFIFLADDEDSTYSLGIGGEAYAVISASDHVGILAGIHVDPAIAADDDKHKISSYGLTLGIMGEFF